MYKEPVVRGKGSVGEKNVFDEEDIKFIKGDGAYLTQEELADYFEISIRTFYNITRRQPDVFAAYQKAKVLKQLSYHKLADDKIFGRVTDGDTALLIFQLKTRCRMAEAAPEPKADEQVIETPEERAARMEDINLFIEWKKERIKKSNRGKTNERKEYKAERAS